VGANAIDAQLHDERIVRSTGARRLHGAMLDDLPDGTFVLRDDVPHLVLGDRLLGWAPAGYESPSPRPPGEHACVITPPSLVALLAAGWEPLVPLLHPSALVRPAPHAP
jgi:hypothetical protein